MSYRKILSVVNEHTSSTVTSSYAISLAAACNAELVLYAAHDEGSNEILLRRTESHLEHLQTISSELNVQVTRITEVGNICTLLPKRVLEEKADLVLYPLTPHERYGAKLKRHTVHHLLRTINSDLAIMRVIRLAKPHPGHILVPLGKKGDVTGRRLMFVTELALGFHSQVTLFHLFADRGNREMPEGISRFRKQLQQQHIEVSERRGFGNIGESIGVEAITRHNDLIVLGASERGGVLKMLFGTPAGYVMHQPPCNTILFRPAPARP